MSSTFFVLTRKRKASLDFATIGKWTFDVHFDTTALKNGYKYNSYWSFSTARK